MHLPTLLFLLPFSLPSTTTAATLPDIARSVSHGALTALQHSSSIFAGQPKPRSRPHTHLAQAQSQAGGPGLRRSRKAKKSCIARGPASGNSTSPPPLAANGTSTSLPPSSSATSSKPSSTYHSSTSPASSSHSSSPPASTTSPAPSANPSAWNLVETYSGSDFFTGWDFWNTADPTHGTVTYVDQPTAQSLSLISANSTSAIMRVSTAQPVPSQYTYRPSVRITTTRTFTGGLLIADIAHLPTGCGTWPALWANGPNWPAGGEIDIVEGVHDSIYNTASIHTNPGCTIPTDYGATGVPALSGPEGYNCAAEETNDSGCGLTDSMEGNFGEPFNAAGGGVYAMTWDTSGIAVYFFPRTSIPADILASTPNPTASTWGIPQGAWPATDCDPYTFFQNNVAIFDTTLCGDWAGNTWGSAAAGAAQSCAASTGYSTCEAYVAANGAAFEEAYWEVYSVKLYQQAGMGP